MSQRTAYIIHMPTGESMPAEVTPKSYQGGKFIKVWQDTGWERRLKELQGNSLRVLWHLVHVAGWCNVVPGPSETGRSMDIQQPHVSEAYSELVEADFLYRSTEGFRLNPLFCWLGDDAGYRQAFAVVSKPTWFV